MTPKGTWRLGTSVFLSLDRQEMAVSTGYGLCIKANFNASDYWSNAARTCRKKIEESILTRQILTQYGGFWQRKSVDQKARVVEPKEEEKVANGEGVP